MVVHLLFGLKVIPAVIGRVISGAGNLVAGAVGLEAEPEPMHGPRRPGSFGGIGDVGVSAAVRPLTDSDKRFLEQVDYRPPSERDQGNQEVQ